MEQLTITITGDAVEHLHHDLEASKYREDLFKYKMMKAQSQAHSLRRFIEQQGIEAQFAEFITSTRQNDNPFNVLREFGFGPDDATQNDPS